MIRRNLPLRLSAAGFSLLELMVVLAVLVIMMAGVFSQINSLQRTYKNQETKVDATAEARNFVDELSREIHQSGFPGSNMFSPNIAPALANPAVNDSRVAAGIVLISPVELQFEGDIDNDGIVESVHYRLMDNNGNPVAAGSNCPCTMQRSVVQKANGAPTGQATNYSSGLGNILNSYGTAWGALTITGATTGTANDVLYANYKVPPIFTTFDQNANPTGVATPVVATVKSIAITINVLPNQDMQSGMRSPVTMTTTAKLNN